MILEIFKLLFQHIGKILKVRIMSHSVDINYYSSQIITLTFGVQNIKLSYQSNSNFKYSTALKQVKFQKFPKSCFNALLKYRTGDEKQ